MIVGCGMWCLILYDISSELYNPSVIQSEQKWTKQAKSLKMQSEAKYMW